jgi:integrase
VTEKYKVYLAKVPAKHSPIVVRFLEECNEDFSRSSVEKHLNNLRKKGYADGTIKWVFDVIRAFYKANNMEWPFKKGEGPVVREMEVFAPALSPDIVKNMIRSARDGVLDEQETAMVALSTVYGLRRTEIASIRSESINYDSQLLFVETAKHGRQRYHLIPDEIIDYLKSYNFRPVSESTVTKVYYRIEKKLGLPRMQEVGWHGIRRILNRLLIDAGLPEFTVMDFLRWKRSTQLMPALYYSVTVVGEEKKVELGKTDREVDEKVFKVHPFLPFWRDGHAEE